MKEALCKAFCDELTVRPVGAGLAVTTPFDGVNGEPLGFYILRDASDAARFYLEDDGATIPLIEANGIDFGSGTRREAFAQLLAEYSATYNTNTCILATSPVPEKQVPSLAFRFTALLLRLRDFALLSPERVASTFRDDAVRLITQTVGVRAQIRQNDTVSNELADFPADLVIRAQGRDPVAIFLGVSEQRISEAIMLQMSATYEARVPLSVVGVLEREDSLTGRSRQRAANRLGALTYFRGDEAATVSRIEREIFGMSGPIGHA